MKIANILKLLKGGIAIKVGIAGAHGTGKTTLLNRVKKEMPTLNIVTGVARDCPFNINEDTTFKSQEWIFREQVKRELAVPINEITISDRTVYDQLAYIAYAYNKGNITDDELKLLEKYISYWGFTYSYIIYIPIEFEMEKDGVRSEDVEFRNEIDQLVQNMLEEYVCDERKCVIKGTEDERYNQLKDLLLKLSIENVI